jgi:hypothetical protein
MYIGSTGPRGLHHLVYQMRYYASVSAFILRHSTLCLVWSLFWFVYNRFTKSWIMLWMKLKRGMLLRLM